MGYRGDVANTASVVLIAHRFVPRELPVICFVLGAFLETVWAVESNFLVLSGSLWWVLGYPPVWEKYVNFLVHGRHFHDFP